MSTLERLELRTYNMFDDLCSAMAEEIVTSDFCGDAPATTMYVGDLMDKIYKTVLGAAAEVRARRAKTFGNLVDWDKLAEGDDKV